MSSSSSNPQNWPQVLDGFFVFAYVREYMQRYQAILVLFILFARRAAGLA